jgi:hypothetical protein
MKPVGELNRRPGPVLYWGLLGGEGDGRDQGVKAGGLRMAGTAVAIEKRGCMEAYGWQKWVVEGARRLGGGE